MKILHISHLYLPSIGGIEFNNKELSERLAAQNHEVTIFTSNASQASQLYPSRLAKEDLPEREVIKGVEVRRFKINYKLYSFLFKYLPKIRGGYRLRKMVFNGTLEMLQNGPFIPRMFFEIFKLKPDVVLTFDLYHTHTYFTYLAKKILKFPLVVLPSLMIPDMETAEEWVNNPLRKRILNAADAIISYTEYEKQFLIKQGVDPNKVCVIGIGIEPKKFEKIDVTEFKAKHKLNGEPIITYLARKVKGKGMGELIDALRLVWKDRPNVKLILAGTKDEHYDQVIQEKLKSLSQDEKAKIIEIDEFTQEEKKNIFAVSDVFAMPSIVDSFGIVYLEAWMCGKPVIACKDTPPSSLISENEDGLLVKYGNDTELAAAILKLVDNKAIREKMGEKGRRKVLHRYTWDIVAKQINDKYSELIEDRQRAVKS